MLWMPENDNKDDIQVFSRFQRSKGPLVELEQNLRVDVEFGVKSKGEHEGRKRAT